MAFEDVLTVPAPLEPPSIRKIPLLQCFLERKKSTFGSGELTLKFEDKTLLVAKKTSRSGNYHIFDATRGRIGGGGAPFNAGAATVSRCVVRLASGEVGFGQVLGRSAEQARQVALLDALLVAELVALEVALDEPEED